MKEKINLTIESTPKEILKKVSEFNNVSMSQFVDDLIRNFYDENWINFRPPHIENSCDENKYESINIAIPSELLDIENEIERLEKLKDETTISLDKTIFFLRNTYNETISRM